MSVGILKQWNEFGSLFFRLELRENWTRVSNKTMQIQIKRSFIYMIPI